MKKGNEKGVLIFIAVIIFIIGGSFVLKAVSSKVKFSDMPGQGNSAGNLYNLGLFCADGERIYFSNPNDQGLIYSMDYSLGDFKRINDDNARYINTDDNYVYYSRMNNLKDQSAQSIFIFYSNGIFRIDKKGRNLSMLWNKPIGPMVLLKNRLYYLHYEEGKKYSVHAIGIDGEGDRKLLSEEVAAVSSYNDRIYYVGTAKDHYLHSFDTGSGSDRVDIERNMFQPVVTGTGIYYIAATDGYKLCSCELDGTGTVCIEKNPCSTFNLSPDGRFIYYQIDDGGNSCICVYDKVMDEKTVIRPGNYKWINTIDKYCFFYDFEETGVYVYTPEGSCKEFDPPLIKKK